MKHISELHFTWYKPLYQTVRIESVPKGFFITQRTVHGRRQTRLFRYDNSPSGYSSVAYCAGLCEAQRIAEAEFKAHTETIDAKAERAK